MAARSMLLGALALACMAAFIQISSAACIKKSTSCASCSSYAPESYSSRCSCVSKPVEAKEFRVYSGIHNNPNAPCQAHYYNLEEPAQEEEKPCVALGYGLQVPSERSEPVHCSSHSYKVETVEPEKSHSSYAYGYLVTEPKRPEATGCHVGSVGYQVETPAQSSHKSSAYGYAVAVPAPRKGNRCISQAYNYQVETPPPPPKEDRYAYGIAVHAFSEPESCEPCVDDYEFPDVPPPPMPKPCVPCEDDYVFPAPEVSVSVRGKSSQTSSECPCQDDGFSSDESNAAGEDSLCNEGDDGSSSEDNTCGGSNTSSEESQCGCGQRYARSYRVYDDKAASDEDDSPPAWVCSGASQAERSRVGFRGISSVWRASSSEDIGEDRDYGEDVRERVFDDTADSHEAGSQTDCGSTSYVSSSHDAPYVRNFVMSKARGLAEDSDESIETGCRNGDSQGYGVRYTSGNSQGYLSVGGGSHDSKEEETDYSTSKVRGWGENSDDSVETGCRNGDSQGYGVKYSSGNSHGYLSVGGGSYDSKVEETDYSTSKVRGWGENSDESVETGCRNGDSQGYGVKYSSGSSHGYLSVGGGSYDSKEEDTKYATSKVRGWGENSDESTETGCRFSDTQGYDDRYSSGNSQGYHSVDSGSYESIEDGAEYASKTIQSSLAPVSHEEDTSYEGGSEFKDGNFNSPVQISSVRYEESGDDEEDSSNEFGHSSSFSDSSLPSVSDVPDSYVEEEKVTSTFNGDSYAGDEYASGRASNYYGYNVGYNSENSGSDTHVQPVPTYLSTHFQREDKHAKYNNRKSASMVYSSTKPFSNSNFDNSVTYDRDAEKSYSVAAPAKYSYEKSEEIMGSGNEGVNSISYGEIGSQNPIYSSSKYENYEDFQKHNIHSNSHSSKSSHASKSSYAPIASASYSGLRRKYDGGLNIHNDDSNSYDGSNAYSSQDQLTIRAPWIETSGYNSYSPFHVATHLPKQEYHGVVGNNFYQEIQTDDHFGGSFAHDSNAFNTIDNSVVGEDKGRVRLPAGGNADDGSYSAVKYDDFTAEGRLSEVESSKGQSHKVLKKVVVVSEEPNVEEGDQVIIEEKELVNGISQEIIEEDVTESVPEEETEVTEAELIGSDADNVEEEPEGSGDEPVGVEETFADTEGTTSDGNPIDAVIYEEGNENDQAESATNDEADEESLSQNSETSGNNEVAEEVVDKDGEIVEKEESSVVETYGKDSDRVVVVEKEDKKEAEVIMEGKPEVVYAKEILVKVSDGHGGEKLVSKEVIETIRPAVAVEITVSEPHHKGTTRTYKKIYSSVYSPSKHSGERVTETVKLDVSGDQEGLTNTKTIKVNSGEQYEGGEVYDTRTTQLENVFTEDGVEAVTPSLDSDEKFKSVVNVNEGSGVEIISVGSAQGEVPALSSEASSSHSGNTVIVTKTTSTEYATPQYNEGDKQLSSLVVGATAGEYLEKKYEPEITEIYEEVTENSDTKYGMDSGNDDVEEPLTEEVSTERTTTYVPKTYSSSHDRLLTASYDGVSEKKASTKHATVTKTYVIDSSVQEEPKVDVRVYSNENPDVEYSSGDEGSYDVGSIQQSGVADYTPSTHPVDVKLKYSTRGDVTVSTASKPFNSFSESGIESVSSDNEGGNVGSIQQSFDSESVDYSPSARYPVDARNKYATGGDVTVSADGRPDNSREFYKGSGLESFSSSRPRVVEETYSPQDYSSHEGISPYRSSNEQVYYDGFNTPLSGFIRVPETSGHWHSRSESRSEAVNSRNSAYRAVEVRGGGGANYYSGEDNGRGGIYQYQPSGGAADQTFVDFYSSPSRHGTVNSQGYVSDSYGARGGAAEVAFGDQGYGNGRVESFAVREANENTKKSLHHHYVSSSVGGSGAYLSRWSSGS